MTKHRKGLWSPDEDQKLTHYVMTHGHGCWSSVPINAGLERNGKSCRLRWINYLRPGLKRGAFSSQEEETILNLHELLGNKWSQMSRHLPGRTDNEIKNYWYSHLKKKVAKSAHLKLHVHSSCSNYTNSSMISTKPSSSCPNTSNFTSSSFTDIVQSAPPISQTGDIPKLLFADWITLDEFQDMSNGQPLDHDSNHHVSNMEHEWLHNKGSTENNQNSKCVDSGSIENMIHTHVTIDQMFEFNNGDFDIDCLMYM